MPCWSGSRSFSWAGACASHSWPPWATRWATPCWNRARSTPAASCWTRAGASWSPPTSSLLARTGAGCGRWAGPSPTGGGGWTSVPAPPPSSSTRSRPPAPCSGTGPWACSRTSVSRLERERWPRRWRRAGASPSSAGATAPAPSPAWGWPTGSTMSPRVAVPRSSSWSTATSPAWLHFEERPMPAEGSPGSRKPLISGNWKMNHSHLEAIQVVQKLSYRLRPADYDAVDVSVHPPFTGLRSIQTLLDADRIPISLGAQNCHWEDQGAFTGEVSAAMLAKLAVAYVIVGHSERRQLFGEDDATVARKTRAVLRHSMTPILCVGETLEEREAGAAQAKVEGQVETALHGLAPEQIGAMVVAYEPIWAIGTGRNATPEDAQAMCAAVRSVVARVAGDDAGAAVRVQYGGSVNVTNSPGLMAQPDVDGALVGGA